MHCKTIKALKGQVIMSNNVLSEQSDLVYRHFFYVVWLIWFLYFVIFFNGMLNVGYYFVFCFPILVN